MFYVFPFYHLLMAFKVRSILALANHCHFISVICHCIKLANTPALDEFFRTGKREQKNSKVYLLEIIQMVASEWNRNHDIKIYTNWECSFMICFLHNISCESLYYGYKTKLTSCWLCHIDIKIWMQQPDPLSAFRNLAQQKFVC